MGRVGTPMADDEIWENEAMVAALAAQRVMALDGSVVPGLRPVFRCGGKRR